MSDSCDDMVQSDHDILVRIDEQIRGITEKMNTFVTKSEFVPVKSIVYGFASLLLTSVILGLLALIIKK